MYPISLDQYKLVEAFAHFTLIISVGSGVACLINYMMIASGRRHPIAARLGVNSRYMFLAAGIGGPLLWFAAYCGLGLNMVTVEVVRFAYVVNITDAIGFTVIYLLPTVVLVASLGSFVYQRALRRKSPR